VSEKRTGFLWAIISAIAVLLVCSGTLIWARPFAVVNNSFDTGVVSIEMRQFELNERGQEIRAEDKPLMILPGVNLSRISRVYNQGHDCYIRVRPEFQGTEQLDDSCFVGVSEDWIKGEDGYFYYQRVLPADQSVVFCDGISVPEDFGDEDAGKNITLTVQVDAIQSRNMALRMDEHCPWGMVEIAESRMEGGAVVNTFRCQTDQNFVVEYQGEAVKLIVNEENFFGNLPELMPGDEFTDGAKLVNNGKYPVRLFFKCIVDDATDITDKIHLLIETEVGGETTVKYDGPMRAEALSMDTLLMTIPAESVGKMVFSVFVPTHLDNAYALQNKTVKWIFSTEEIKPAMEGVETGDQRQLGGYMILAGLSLGFAVRMLQRKRGGNGSRD